MTVPRRWLAASSICLLAALPALALGGPSREQAKAKLPNLAYVQAQITKFRALPKFVAPGPAFDAKKAVQGKNLFIIPASSNVPFVTTIADGMVNVAKGLGLKTTVWQNQGQPSEWVQGMNSAVSQKATNIDLLAGIDPAALTPQITQATGRDVTVTVSHLYDVNQPVASGLSATVDIPYNQAGRLLADWAILKTKGNTNALVTIINQVNSTKPMVAGIKNEFTKYCGPKCKLTFIDTTIPELQTKLQGQVQTALTRDPKINYVICLYDSAQSPFAEAAIRALGKGKTLKIVTFNGTPDIMKKITKTSIVQMDVGENLDWISRGILDQEMRLMAGLKPSQNPNIPIRVFDASNVRQAGTPPENGRGFGSAYVAGYNKLWGVSS
jgi:ribose transport system substrate-binding protein